MPKRKYFLLIVILGTVSALSPFSIDMYLPAFPAISADLHTSISHIQFSLTSFFIGISVGQLIYGPLVDRFGRKKPIYAGLVLYVIASAGCALTRSVHVLIWLRLVQALGSCAGMVASRALVRDLFKVEEIAKVFSLLMLVIAVSPLIAPTLGGYLSAAFGWHSIFLILGAIALVILTACLLWLPAGRREDPGVSLKPVQMLQQYRHVLRDPKFFTYALTGSIGGAALYAYISGSPDVFINLYHVSQKEYGWIFASIAFGLIGSSQVNSVLLARYTSEQIIRIALMIQAGLGCVMLATTTAGYNSEYLLIALIFCFLCCQGFIFPNSSALSLVPFEQQAGSASALMGTLQMAFGAFTSALVGFLHNGTALPMAGVMAVCSAGALVWLMLFRKRAAGELAGPKNAEIQTTKIYSAP